MNDLEFILWSLFFLFPVISITTLCVYADSISKDLNESDEQEGEE